MAPNFFFTKTWHNTTYNAIDPTRPELSFAGKTIVITGAGAGIGARMVQSFAQAGAAHIAITARREATLQAVKSKIEAAFPKTKVSIHVGDVVNASDLARMAARVGPWDVLVANAGYLSKFDAIVSSNMEDWWRGFEVNLKGTFLTLQAFTPSAKEGASVVGVSTAVTTFSGEESRTASSYASSKTGLIKLMEIYAAENPGIAVKTIHPGVIETDMLEKSGLSELPIDDISLPADFTVWIASKEADFLRGRFVYCNWDVSELISMSRQILADPKLLTLCVDGHREVERG